MESVSAWACYRLGRQPPGSIRKELLGRVRELPNQLFLLTFPESFSVTPDGHGQRSSGKREHSPALELSPGQRSVLYLYGRPTFCQPGRREPAAILRKSLRYQVHVLMASVR